LANDHVPDQLLVAAREGSDPATVWKLPIRAGTLDQSAQFLPPSAESPAAAIAISHQGYVVVTSASGDQGSAPTELRFHTPLDGQQVMALPLGLENVRALAYSPRSGNLYAASYGAEAGEFNPEESGIFRIEDASQPGKPAARAVRVANVVRPTDLAFAADGTLYVSTTGELQPSAGKQGAIIHLSGDL
jgi:glucose/arabinose dehydrogenase